MKVGQRDVWIGVGKGEQTPRRWWVVFSPLGREWIPPECVGRPRGFWLHDVPRRFSMRGPGFTFVLALAPGSRWARMRDGRVVGWRWVELTRLERR